MSEIEPLEQFEGIRKVWDEATNEWWYAVVDAVEILTESSNAQVYWRQMKLRDRELVTNCNEFPMKHRKNNRTYQTDCASEVGILRIIQSIPSSKAEPFKQWLAVTGSRRLKEVNDPYKIEEERLRLLGYSQQEIGLRIDRMRQKNALWAEWQARNVVQEEGEFLEQVIHKETFGGLTEEDHRQLKRLLDDDGDLADHMQPMELAFDFMGKAATLEEIQTSDPVNFEENHEAAAKGGKVAGDLREKYEAQTGRKVISDKSPLIERRKEIENKNAND